MTSVIYREERKRLYNVLVAQLNNKQREKTRSVLVELYNSVVYLELNNNFLSINELRDYLISLEFQLFKKYNIENSNEKMIEALFPVTLEVNFYIQLLEDVLRQIIEEWKVE